MKKFILFFFLLLCLNSRGQEKIEYLNYSHIKIPVPENCLAKSEFELIDCDGFSVQWLFLNEMNVKLGVHKIIQGRMAEKFEFKKKKSIQFTSQNQKFRGSRYEMQDGSFRIIAFGRINKVPLILNMGFKQEPKNNTELSEFEKNFIQFSGKSSK